jgi:hypothetical protein
LAQFSFENQFRISTVIPTAIVTYRFIWLPEDNFRLLDCLGNQRIPAVILRSSLLRESEHARCDKNEIWQTMKHLLRVSMWRKRTNHFGNRYDWINGRSYFIDQIRQIQVTVQSFRLDKLFRSQDGFALHSNPKANGRR